MIIGIYNNILKTLIESLYFKFEIFINTKTSPVACALIYKNKVIKTFVNINKKHCEFLLIEFCLDNHIEIEYCDILITLEPCPMCFYLLSSYKIRNIIFGAYNIKEGSCGGAFFLFNNIEGLFIPKIIGGIQEQLCSKILSEFFKKKRQKIKLTKRY
jgi:tRNA(adenine34) deaminase